MIKKVAYNGEYKFGELIRSQRVEKGLSIRKLAELTGLSPGAISRWESGKRIPSIESFNKVIAALGAELYVMEK